MSSTSSQHFNIEFGFTLIEIVIVVAITGILSAIAIPQYQIYVAKAQTTRLIGELGELRLSVESCLQTGITNIGLDTDECDPRASASNLIIGGSQVGVVLPNNMGVAQLSNPLTSTSNITAIVSNQVIPSLSGKKIEWRRTSNGSWGCRSNIDSIYLPQACTYDASL